MSEGQLNQENLIIYIIPSGIELLNVKHFNPENGQVFSNLNEIKVNKMTNSGYSILYTTNDITNMDMNIFGNNVIKLFMKNLPGKNICIQLCYLYEVRNNNYELYDDIDISVVNAILELENKFINISENSQMPFTYNRSQYMNTIIKNIINNYNDINDDTYDDDDDTMDDFFESLGINSYYDNDDSDYEDDSDDDYDDRQFSFLDPYVQGKKIKNKHKKDYQESRIFYEAKNAKRSYNRHGVIICNDKKAKERDEKILKEFLKEFFPGDAQWKKDFRRDVLKRWMKMYCVSKKNLKELEKANRKIRNSNRINNINTEKTLEFTRRLFNVPIDRWNDPSR